MSDTNTMKLVVPVDQAECLRHGIAAPSSTVTLDVDPSQLTSVEREVLAESLVKGHLIERLAVPGGHEKHAVAICPPTLEGLVASVLGALGSERTYWTREIERALERSQRVEACRVTVTEGPDAATVSYEAPYMPHMGIWDTANLPDSARRYIDPDILARYDARRDEVTALRAEAEAKARTFALAQLPAIRSARLAKEAERAAAKKLEEQEEQLAAEGMQRLVAHFPPSARERALAGCLPRTERERCVADAILSVALMDLPDAVRGSIKAQHTTPGWDHLRELETFDARTWEIVREVRRLCAVAPSRFELEDVVEVWDRDEAGEGDDRRTIVRVRVTAHHNSTLTEIEVDASSRAAFASDEWEAWISSHTPGER